MIRYNTSVSGALLMIAILAGKVEAQSAGFRVETDVFASTDRAPIQQSLTLFKDGVAYDLPRDDSGEIILVDPSRDRIVLLDSKRRLKTEVAISELNKILVSAKNQVSTTDLSVYIDSASKVSLSDNKVVVGDELLRYEASLQGPSDEQLADRFAGEYRRFADAVLELNSFRSGGLIPPFARMTLNGTIREQKRLPEEITITAKQGKNTVRYRTLLASTWLLSKADEARIHDIGKTLVDCEMVSWSDFVLAQREAANEVAARPQPINSK